MPYCEYPDDFMPYDITPVENLFLLEHMPHAPGDYVRVYLYGLMLCRYPMQESSAETVAKALGLKPQEVSDAFAYWERTGLVVKLSDNPPRYRYLSPQRALMGNADPAEGAYQYRDFFNQLQQLLGADRLLAPQDQSRAIDWVETLKLPEEIVLLLVESQVAKAHKAGRSLRYIFRDMDKLALRWASEDIRTLEAAELWLVQDSAAAEIARALLERLNVRRNPSLEEIEVAEKWVGELHLNKKDVLAACTETTKTTNPSFAYIDSVLRRKAAGSGIRYFDQIKEVLRALGAHGSPTEAHSALYEKFLSDGFDQEAILHAAGQCSLKSKRRFEDLQRKLDNWKKQGITSRKAAEEFARSREPATRLLNACFALCSPEAQPTPNDISTAFQWMKVFPEEVILYLAQLAADRGTLKPMPYMKKILAQWQEQNITTLAQAKADVESHARPEKPASPTPARQNPARQYSQRTYDSDLIDRVAVDFSDLSGDEQK